MGRVHRVIAALMLMAFIPVTVLAGPMRLCVSQEGHQAIELAHLPHAGDEVHAAAVAQDAAIGIHDELPSCFDRPLITAHSSNNAAKTDGKLSKPDGNSGVALPAGLGDLAAASAPRALARHPYPGHLASNPQLAALRTVVLLI